MFGSSPTLIGQLVEVMVIVFSRNSRNAKALLSLMYRMPSHGPVSMVSTPVAESNAHLPVPPCLLCYVEPSTGVEDGPEVYEFMQPYTTPVGGFCANAVGVAAAAAHRSIPP